MAAAGARSYCCQYRESDLDFVTRLLTEEGLSWRIEETDEGHGVVLFGDSSQASATPEDASSSAGGGIRFHGARAGEAHDSVQSLRARRSLRVGLSTVLSYDYKAKKAVAASVPTAGAVGGPNAPLLESFDTPGQYFYADGAQARRYALLQMQANEARRHLWHARSTVRTLRAGTRFSLTQGPLQAGAGDDADPAYVALRVVSVGVNNLPKPAREGLPMLSAIVTSDSIDVLAERLAAWCTVATGRDYFNFRFPDTRRLPAIFAVLMSQQQRELAGNALSWHYIARNGAWAALPIDYSGPAAGTTVNARPSEAQFARLIEDSEADELWVRLQYGGDTWDGLPSERHDLLKEAVQVARQHNLDHTGTLKWCAKLMATVATGSHVNVLHVFLNFHKEFAGRFNDDLQNTV